MTKLQSTQYTKEKDENIEDILGQTEVRPGHMESISLGMYEQGMPEPTLTLEVTPDTPDAINASLVRLDEDDHYTLVYQVQNFGDVTYRVRVSES
jgi:hypothetical protein